MKLLMTSGIRKRYKPGQLMTINKHVYQVIFGTCLCCQLIDKGDTTCLKCYNRMISLACCLKLIK